MRFARVVAGVGVIAFAAAVAMTWLGLMAGVDVSWPTAWALWLTSVTLISNACSYSTGHSDGRLRERTIRRARRFSAVASSPAAAGWPDASLTGVVGSATVPLVDERVGSEQCRWPAFVDEQECVRAGCNHTWTVPRGPGWARVGAGWQCPCLHLPREM